MRRQLKCFYYSNSHNCLVRARCKKSLYDHAKSNLEKVCFKTGFIKAYLAKQLMNKYDIRLMYINYICM